MPLPVRSGHRIRTPSRYLAARIRHGEPEDTLGHCDLGWYVAFLQRMERGRYSRDGRFMPETLTNDTKPWTLDIGAPTRRAVRFPGWVTNTRKTGPTIATEPLTA